MSTNTTAQRTVIITGGTSGLGYQTASALLRQSGWHVIITSRKHSTVATTVDALRTATNNRNICGEILDLASLASVRDFANRVISTDSPPLHAIVANAGVMLANTKARTVDGFEKTFAVNHLGHFLLVHLLLPHLARPARIINVASGVYIPSHKLARVTGVPRPKYVQAAYLANPENAPKPARITHPGQAYSTSKLANVLYTYELSRQLEAQGLGAEQIGVYALDPGLMPDTGLAREFPAVLRIPFMGAIQLIAPLFSGIRHSRESGEHITRLLTDDAMAGRTALYLDGQWEATSSQDSYRLDLATDLWAYSLKAAKIDGLYVQLEE